MQNWAMLAKSATRNSLETKRAAWDGYVMDLKVDGMRVVAASTDEGVKVYGRSGLEYTDHVPHIVFELFQMLPVGTKLDGELVYVEGYEHVLDQRVPLVSFNKTMRVMGSLAPRALKLQGELGPLVLLVFDIMSYGARDLSVTPYRVRRSFLEDRFATELGDGSYVMLTPLWRSWDHGTYDALVSVGAEGVIMKNESSVYTSGRPNKSLYKIKHDQTFDVVVMGFTEANFGKTGRWAGKVGAIKFGAYDETGHLKYVGRCSGMTETERDYWTEIRDSGVGSDPNLYYMRLGLVIEIKANDFVGSGKRKTPRHPQYVGQRLDKKSEECLLEQFEV